MLSISSFGMVVTILLLSLSKAAQTCCSSSTSRFLYEDESAAEKASPGFWNMIRRAVSLIIISRQVIWFDHCQTIFTFLALFAQGLKIRCSFLGARKIDILKIGNLFVPVSVWAFLSSHLQQLLLGFNSEGIVQCGRSRRMGPRSQASESGLQVYWCGRRRRRMIFSKLRMRQSRAGLLLCRIVEKYSAIKQKLPVPFPRILYSFSDFSKWIGRASERKGNLRKFHKL